MSRSSILTGIFVFLIISVFLTSSVVATPTVTHGPVISTNSTCTKFRVFVRAKDSGIQAVNVRILYNVVGTTSYGTTGTFVAAYDDDWTVIAEFPGESEVLQDDTLYRYKIVLDNVPQAEWYRVRSLYSSDAESGNFALYHLSDSHGAREGDDQPWANDVDGLFYHYRNTFYTQGIPAALIYTGDLFVSQGPPTDIHGARDFYKALYATPEIKKLFASVPVFQMWDDQDYAGDNSNRERRGPNGSVPLTTEERTNLVTARMEYVPCPVDSPGPESDTYYYVKIGGVPIICADSRYYKDPYVESNDHHPYYNVCTLPLPPKTCCEENQRDCNADCVILCDGSQDMASGSMLGSAQRNWISEIFNSDGFKRAKLKFFISTTTFVDNVLPIPNIPCYFSTTVRDSFGLYYKDERNHLLSKLVTPDPDNDVGFVVLSGDDHIPWITRRNLWWEPYQAVECDCVERNWISSVPQGCYEDFGSLGSPDIWEFKAGNGGGTHSYFFWDNIYKENGVYPFRLKWYGGCGTGDPGYGGADGEAEWGHANSSMADIGFVWNITFETDPEDVQATVEAMMFEQETSLEGCQNLEPLCPLLSIDYHNGEFFSPVTNPCKDSGEE